MTKAQQNDLNERALNHDCPDCGAKRTVRCRILRPNRTNPARTTVDVRPNQCPDRVTLAWREHLSEQAAA